MAQTKTYKVLLDTKETISNPAFTINTNDLKTVKLSILINQDGDPLNLMGATVRLAVKKPDRKTVLQDCTIVAPATDGSCEVVLDTQAYAIKGDYEAEVMVYYGSDTVAVTSSFSYTAKKGILSDDTIESTNEWQSITQAIADNEAILEDLRTKGTGVDAQARADISTQATLLAQKATEINNVSNNVVTAKEQLSGAIYDNSGALDLSSATITSDPTKHLAFPTIAFFLNKYIVMYRNGTGHTSIDGKIVYKTSDDMINWSAEQVLIENIGMDYRDPSLITFNGKLVLKYFNHDGGSNRKTCLRHTTDLITWSSEIVMPSPNGISNASRGNMAVKDGKIYMLNYKVDATNGYVNDAYLVSTDLITHSVVGEVKAETNEASIHWNPYGFGFIGVFRQSAESDGSNNNKPILLGKSTNGITWTFKELPIRGHAPSLRAVGDKLIVTYRSLDHAIGTQFNMVTLQQDGEFSSSRIYNLFARNNWDIGYGDVLVMTDNVYFVYYDTNKIYMKSILRTDVLDLSPFKQKRTYKYVSGTIRQGDIIQQLIGDVVVTGDGTAQKDFTIDLTPLALTGQLRAPNLVVAHTSGSFSVRLKSFSLTAITGTLKVDTSTFSTPITVSWSALNTTNTYKAI